MAKINKRMVQNKNVLVGKIARTRKYPLHGYILGSGAPGTPGVTPKTLGATFISESRHLELLMG